MHFDWISKKSVLLGYDYRMFELFGIEQFLNFFQVAIVSKVIVVIVNKSLDNEKTFPLFQRVHKC